MKNIHVLPTDKPSRLVKLKLFGKDKYNFSKEILPIKDEEQYQNIYITNDEEIKEGDWFYVKTPNIQGGNIILKSSGFGKNCWSQNILTETTDEKGYDPTHCVRIILTTDQDLIKDGVQAIDDEFLEWFVKNPSCEEVEVKKGFPDGTAYGYNFLDYKIIIPKEEPKQETLEEAAEHNYLGGDVWTEEEVYSLLEQSMKDCYSWELEEHYSGDYKNLKDWFEQFKKK